MAKVFPILPLYDLAIVLGAFQQLFMSPFHCYSPCSFIVLLSLPLPPPYFFSHPLPYHFSPPFPCRHPDHHSRVSFTEVVQSLNYDQRSLLKVDPRDKIGTPLSLTLGAPLEHGQELHEDLQDTYKKWHCNYIHHLYTHAFLHALMHCK